MSSNLPTDYQTYIHASRYARWIPEENRRETWEETVTRYTDFFKDRIKSILPKEHINKKITDIENVSENIVSSLGKDLTIGQALKLDLSALMRKTKISKNEAINLRRVLIGVSPKDIRRQARKQIKKNL